MREALRAMALVAFLGTAAGAQVDDAAALAAARSLSQAFAAVARKITPAVVNISSTRVERGRDSGMPGFMRRMFPEMMLPDQTVISLGSGVILRPDGYIVTNCHVIEGAEEITVRLGDDREFAAEVVGQDPFTDLAVIRIGTTGLQYAECGDSDRLEVGEWVIAVGSPLGLAQTVTAGIVSAKGRKNIGLQGFEDFIQTDAAINRGNSGGALVDLDGRLVGINTAIASEGGGYDGVCFATPVAAVRPVVDALIRDGHIVRPWAGIQPKTVDHTLATRFGLGVEAGVFVSGLFGNSPAHQGGLRPGDVITKWQGQDVRSTADLSRLIQATAIGAQVELVVVRGGQSYRAPLTVRQLPAEVMTPGVL
jgi:Do/DeqQ family serine protease